MQRWGCLMLEGVRDSQVRSVPHTWRYTVCLACPVSYYGSWGAWPAEVCRAAISNISRVRLPIKETRSCRQGSALRVWDADPCLLIGTLGSFWTALLWRREACLPYL